jgi:type IV pilus assembly protein PilC
MGTYKYVAVAPDGTKVRAAAEAASANVLRHQLALRELNVVKVRERKPFAQIEITRERVPRAAVMHFSRQMAAFVRGGIPMTDALQVVQEGVDNKRFREILASVAEELRAGTPFSEALAGYGSVFPSYYIGILRSAEHTGRLDVVLEQLAEYMERDLEASQRLRSALTYPIVIAFAAIGVVVLMATFVLPRLTKFFKEFGAKLPLSTRILLAVSNFFKNYWFVTPIVGLLAVAAVLWLMRAEKGQELRDRAFLKLWLVRDIVRYAAIERFCRIIGAMMHAGVPLPEAMRAAIQSVNNRVFEQRLEAVNEAMLEGEGMAAPIGASGLFPRAAVQMMRVGEETGTLDNQLQVAAEYYGSELEYKLKRLMALFEPAVIVFMGVIVGFVAVAMVQSIYGMIHGSKLGR